jgi:hypothetical protein
MAKDWDHLTDYEKLEMMRRDMRRVLADLSALMSDIDEVWDAMRGTWDAMSEARSELGKNTKDVATLKALWPYPKKYSRTG